MNIFLAYFLIHWGVMVIAYKYNVSGFIKRMSNKYKIKFLYDLSECEFCIEHHIGFIGILPLFLYELNFENLAFPFMSASLINIIKTLKK